MSTNYPIRTIIHFRTKLFASRGGPGPFSYIDMGGMFTVLKVRDDPSAAPNAWYRHPQGTIAGPADAARMTADGVDPAALARR